MEINNGSVSAGYNIGQYFKGIINSEDTDNNYEKVKKYICILAWYEAVEVVPKMNEFLNIIEDTMKLESFYNISQKVQEYPFIYSEEYIKETIESVKKACSNELNEVNHIMLSKIYDYIKKRF